MTIRFDSETNHNSTGEIPNTDGDASFDRGRRFRNAIQRLLWWAPGKAPSILQTCTETVRLKYSAIGVWLTFVIPTLAGFAMAEFLKNLHFGTVAAYAGGIFWSLTILAMERIMLTYPNGANKTQNWLRAIPRFAIALCASFLITETLICLGLKGEIQAEMARGVDRAVAQKATDVRAENEERSRRLMAENNRLKAKLDELVEVRRMAEKAMHDEADGTGGTFIEGEGDNYRRRKEAFDRAAAEYESEGPLIEDKVRANDTELATIDAALIQAEADKRSVEEDADGLLARHEALMRIVSSSSSARLLYAAMMLLLMLIELLPLLQKLIAAPDEYDLRVQLESERRELTVSEERIQTLEAVKQSSDVQAVIRKRLFRQIGNGVTENLPRAERPIGDRLYGEILQTIADRLLVRRPTTPDSSSDFTECVRLEVHGKPDLKAVVSLPRAEMKKIKIGDLKPEFDSIAAALSERDGNIYRFNKAENSLGLEIWSDAPLATQLEPDRLARLLFSVEGPDFGLSP